MCFAIFTRGSTCQRLLFSIAAGPVDEKSNGGNTPKSLAHKGFVKCFKCINCCWPLGTDPPPHPTPTLFNCSGAKWILTQFHSDLRFDLAARLLIIITFFCDRCFCVMLASLICWFALEYRIMSSNETNFVHIAVPTENNASERGKQRSNPLIRNRHENGMITINYMFGRSKCRSSTVTQ